VVQVEATAYHEARFAGKARDYREKFRTLLETGMRVPAIDYSQALRQCRLFRRQIEMLITEFDALLMPVAGAPAPKGLTSTGDPILRALELCGGAGHGATVGDCGRRSAPRDPAGWSSVQGSGPTGDSPLVRGHPRFQSQAKG